MITIGVDLGIRKIAWSIWEDDILDETEAYESTRSIRHEQLTDLATVFMSAVMTKSPDQIFIEDVLIGNNRKYSLQLAETKGAVLSAIGVVTQTSFMDGKYTSVIPVNNKTWKKEILGNGNASKDDISSYIFDLDHAYTALCGRDQDRYDAACIGYYGYVISRRAQALGESGFSYSSERT